LIAALDEHQIDYALCGGLAMAVYDRARATVDIDVLILSESLELVIPIATKLDYKIRGLDMTFSAGKIEIRRVSKIDHTSGQMLSLDLLLVTPTIQSVWDSRVEADWDGGTLSVVSRPGLIALKKLRGSPQDVADIAALEEDLTNATN
jgi:hypothetical protein